jgi:hypothetical protein
MTKYINKILNKFRFNNLNPVSTPMDPKIKLEPNKEQATSVKYFDRRPPQRRQRRASDGPATATMAVTSLSIF